MNQILSTLLSRKARPKQLSEDLLSLSTSFVKEVVRVSTYQKPIQIIL